MITNCDIYAGNLFMAVKFYPNGDLNKYLRNYHKDYYNTDEGAQFLYKSVSEVARGMCFLQEMKVKYINRIIL